MGHSYYRIHRNAVKSKCLCLSLSRLPGLVHVTQLMPQTPGCIHFTPYTSMVKASLEDVIMKGESPGIQLCRLEPDGALGSDGAVVNAVTYFTACLSLGAFLRLLCTLIALRSHVCASWKTSASKNLNFRSSAMTSLSCTSKNLNLAIFESYANHGLWKVSK